MGMKNINAWTAKTEKAKQTVRTKAAEHVRAKVKQVFRDALTVSPQFSGNYVQNWHVTVAGNSDPRYNKSNKPGSGIGELGRFPDWRSVPKSLRRLAGDKRSIKPLMDELEDTFLPMIKWNSRIGLVNTAPVAEMLDRAEVKLRPGNDMTGGVGVTAYLKMKYRFIR